MEKKFVGEKMWWCRKRGGRRWGRGSLGVFVLEETTAVVVVFG
jgi:hypothetical protein